jgi:predicted permease
VITPPRLAERLLLRRLAADERDELIGDINEQFSSRAASGGLGPARRWYWRQTLALLWGFSLDRRDLISTAHERTRGRWALNNMGVDVRSAWRGLKHSPSFAIVALLTLAIGIGLSTAMFSLVNAILLDPLPYAHAERLVRVVDSPPQTARAPVHRDGTSMGDTSIGAWLSMETALAKLSPYDDNPLTVILPNGADNLVVSDVGRDFFSVLSMPPVAGRVLGEADFDPAAPGTAVISERLARRVFGGPQAALGQSVDLDTRTLTVVGVLSPAFAFPNKDVDIWRIGAQYRRFPAPGARRNVAMRCSVIGLLKDGTTLADAHASGVAVGRAMVEALIATGDESVRPTTFETRRLLDDMVAPVRPALLLLAGGTVAVLIAVCVNLANLLLARNTARQREVAVRLALGADRWRVGRPILIELLLLSTGGGVTGALLAWWMLRSLPALAPASFPRIENIHFDFLTLAFAVGASFLTALVVGWLPTLQMPTTNVQELTSRGGRVRLGRLSGSGDLIRGLLVTAQVALAMVLLVTALLIGRSFQQLLQVDLGYAPDGVLTFQSAQPFANARQDGRLRGYFTTLIERLKAHPAITSAGFAAALPMHPVMIRSSVNIVGREAEFQDFKYNADNMAVNQPVSADYLRTIGTRIVRGRGFSTRDTSFSEKVILIDEALERLYFPVGDAIGHQLKYAQETWRIVGVAQAMQIAGLGDKPLPVLYFLTDQMKEFLAYAKPGGGIAIRTDGDPRVLIPFVRDTARAVDPTVPLYNVQRLTDDIRVNVAQPRFFTIILGLFGALSLSTALLGIYGVLAYAVEQRRMEFGIRRALGATDSHVITLVMRRGVALAAVGIAIGLGGSAAASHYLRSLLFGITPADPVSFVGAATLVLAVVCVASWQPVRRALRIDPASALRVD